MTISIEAYHRCTGCGTSLPDPAPDVCPGCDRRLRTSDGLLDFVVEQTSEREYYEHEYTGDGGEGDLPRTAGLDELRALHELWDSTYYPMNLAVLDAVGSVRGRDVLLIGNGTSLKELYFLTDEPRRLIFSDYSLSALRTVRRELPLDPSRFPVVYAAIDALELPFVDESVDVVYGYAFAHHLRDPRPFLSEAARVLAPGGRAIFMDNRPAPLYQKAKLTYLRPLMDYYHRLGGISPEDLHATTTGWYSEPELEAMLLELEVEPFFERSLLVHYLVTRASERLPPERLFLRYRQSRRAQRALIRLDSMLERSRTVRENQMRLVWGFTKPATPMETRS